MKYLTLQNPYSIYFINKYKYGHEFLNDFLNARLRTNEEYILQDYFNNDYNDVRSYIIFESINNIVMVGFTSKKNYCKEIYNFLIKTSNKKVHLILIDNNKKGNNIWHAKSIKDQFKYNPKLAIILYKMDSNTRSLYNHEEYLKQKFDN